MRGMSSVFCSRSLSSPKEFGVWGPTLREVKLKSTGTYKKLVQRRLPQPAAQWGELRSQGPLCVWQAHTAQCRAARTQCMGQTKPSMPLGNSHQPSVQPSTEDLPSQAQTSAEVKPCRLGTPTQEAKHCGAVSCTGQLSST